MYNYYFKSAVKLFSSHCHRPVTVSSQCGTAGQFLIGKTTNHQVCKYETQSHFKSVEVVIE